MIAFFKEPLVHFVLIGAALFATFQATRGRDEADPNRIVVTAGQVESLAANFSRTWMRPPTPQELTHIVSEHVRDEVFYREALALGMDKDDTLIRRRMRQKLEFILEDVASQVDPSDEDLAAFMAENPETFREKPKLSFRQVYLSSDKRQDIPADAKEMLVQIKAGEDPDQLGDRSMLESTFELLGQDGIERRFGTEFARQVVTLPVDEWSGPVVSGYGGHLVLVSERVDGRMPELEEVREAVVVEWGNQKRKAVKEETFQDLLNNYEVVIEENPDPVETE